MRVLCFERRVEQDMMEAVLLQSDCFHTNGSRHRSSFTRWLQWSWSRPGAWVSCGSQAEARATASGRRSGSCHHATSPLTTSASHLRYAGANSTGPCQLHFLQLSSAHSVVTAQTCTACSPCRRTFVLCHVIPFGRIPAVVHLITTPWTDK